MDMFIKLAFLVVFFGVMVLTAVQTPRFCGESLSVITFFLEFSPFKRAGAFAFFSVVSRPLRTSWLKVGKFLSPPGIK